MGNKAGLELVESDGYGEPNLGRTWAGPGDQDVPLRGKQHYAQPNPMLPLGYSTAS
jgi:hypothetical protein